MNNLYDLRMEMQGNGLTLEGDLIFDNTFQRFKVDRSDDKKSGWFVGYEVPSLADPNVKFLIASYGNWKTSENYTFKNKHKKISKEDRMRLDEEIKRHELEIQRKKKEEHDRVAIDARAQYEEHRRARWQTEYSKKKRFGNELWGARPGIDDEGAYLLVPMRNIEGEIRNVQKIRDSGDKRFKKGGEVRANFHATRWDEGCETFYITEGFATAVTVSQAIGSANVLCAFSAGNLSAVAIEIRRRHPNGAIIICADNDPTGIEKAVEAKNVVLAQLKICPEDRKDFNDLGPDATREFLSECGIERPDKGEIVVAGFTKKNSIDTLTAYSVSQGKVIFDAARDAWYRYNIVWEKCFESDIKKIFLDTMQRGIPEGFQNRDFESFFKMTKLRLSRTQEWNGDKNLLPFRNGVLNLKTMELKPHDWKDHFNWYLPYDYDPTRECPNTLQYLNDLSQGNTDAYDVLVCFLAAVIRGRADLQRYLELVGISGTGKTTYLNLAADLVGEENVMTTTMTALENKFETAGFYGKRLVLIMDAKSYSKSEDIFKGLTGQDKLRYEEKNKQIAKPFVYDGMVCVAANTAIQFDDRSTAIARRRVTVHVDKMLENVDEEIGLKLRAELPGLMNHILEIPNEWIKSTLKAATSINSTSHKRALIATNVIAQWVDECCTLDEGVGTQVGKKKRNNMGAFEDAETRLYPNYLRWCEQTGRKEMNIMNFSNSLQDLITTQKWKVDKRRMESGISYVGLRCVRTGEVDVCSPFGCIPLHTNCIPGCILKC